MKEARELLRDVRCVCVRDEEVKAKLCSSSIRAPSHNDVALSSHRNREKKNTKLYPRPSSRLRITESERENVFTYIHLYVYGL